MSVNLEQSQAGIFPGWWYGWWIIVVSIIGQALSVGTLFVYTFGIFVKPLSAEFGASRGPVALAVALLNLLITIGAPLTGRLVDRFGGRRVIVTALVALSCCLFAMTAVTAPLWHLYVVFALAGLVGAATSPVAYARVVANWFDHRLGLALGIASTGIGLGAIIMPSLAQFLLDSVGWRKGYAVLGGACLLLAAPVVALFLKGSPQEVGLLPDGESAPRTVASESDLLSTNGLTLAEALRTRTFWQLCAIFFAVSACANGASSHLAPMLTDKGMAGRTAALAASLFGAATILGRVGNGYLVDRFFAPHIAAGLFAGAVLGLAMLWSGVGGAGVFIASALLGLAIGAESDVMPFLVSRYFGRRAMGAVFGCIFASYTIGFAAGQYLLGVGFDKTGSYRTSLAWAFGVMLLATLATFGLGQYKQFAAVVKPEST
jgi:MFS family permease